MINNYKFVYGTDEAKVWFSVDTEVFTKEMAESNLDFFDWYYDKEADPIEEIIKKYKKYINGKERTIYKKRGDRKEYIKVKGELKYVKDYKGKKVK